MDQIQFEKYLAMPTPEAPEVLVSADDIGPEDRTLCLGYTLDRETFHVYTIGRTIHRVIYTSHLDGTYEVHEHRCGFAIQAAALVPDKRAYPHATDLRFATHMLRIGHPLTFTSFNPEADSAKPTQFRGHVPGLVSS